MKLIYNNPFRILGLSLTATEREIAKQVDLLLTYAEMGKTKSFDTDFSFFPFFDRNPHTIEQAKKQIEQAESKLLYSLFWFWKNNSVDELAFEVLKDGHVEKAEAIWEKSAFSNKHKIYKPIPLYEDLIQQSTSWSTQDDEDHCLKKDDYQYKIERKKETSSSIPVVHADLNYTDNWTIEVETEWHGGVDNIGYGIIFGRDKGSYFMFDIAANGYYCFSKNIEWSFSKILPWKESQIIEKRSKNRFLIKKIDDVLHFYINSKYVDSIASEPFFGSYFGFKVTNNQTVSFRNFKFCRLVEDETYGEGLSVSLKTFSNIKNLSTLYLSLSLASTGGKFNINHFKKGITLAKNIFKSESINDYSKLIAGERYNYTAERAIQFYINNIIDPLKPFLDKPEGISIYDFVRAFTDFPPEAKQFLNNRFFSKQLQSIDEEIETARTSRRASVVDAINVGKTLVKNTMSDLEYLKKSLGNQDYQFQTISDKLSAEILQCGIDAFNSWKTPSGEVDFPKAIISEERYISEYEYALSVAITDRAKEKAQENVNSCKRLIEDKQYYTCWFCSSNPPEEVNKFEITIYKETYRSYFPRRVQFQYVPVNIPRCSECQKIHGRSSDNFNLSLIGLSIAGLIIGIIADGNWFAGLLIGAIIGWIVGSALKSNQTSKAEIKRTNHSTIREFPTLKQALAEGWQFSKPTA